MEREAQAQPEAPVQESSPEPVQESFQEAPQQEQTNHETPDAPAEQPQAEQPQEQPEAYDESDIEGAVLNYLSERLGRDISDFDSLSQPQAALDERVEAISRFISDTGRSPEDWFSYQRMNPSEMDDSTAIRVSLATEYPDLSTDEINLLVDSKYKLDPDLHSEEELQIGRAHV